VSESVETKLAHLEEQLAELLELVRVPAECRMLNVRQVAAALAVSQRTVYGLVADGEFPAGRHVGRSRRWPARQVQRWVDAEQR